MGKHTHINDESEPNRFQAKEGLPQNLPIYDIPDTALGNSKRHRKLGIQVQCAGTTYSLGWLLFGMNDESFYLHQTGQSPILKIGNAMLKKGRFVSISEKDITQLPEAQRSGTHISLHPSGEVHLKTSGGHEVTAANIGQWFPVTQEFIFAYWFTGPVASLPVAQKPARAFLVPDPSKSLRLDILISPWKRIGEKAFVPRYTNTIFVGGSPHYAVLLNASLVSACEPCLFFLASPLDT